MVTFLQLPSFFPVEATLVILFSGIGLIDIFSSFLFSTAGSFSLRICGGDGLGDNFGSSARPGFSTSFLTSGEIFSASGSVGFFSTSLTVCCGGGVEGIRKTRQKTSRRMRRPATEPPMMIQRLLSGPLLPRPCLKNGPPLDSFDRSCWAFLRASMIRLILFPPGRSSPFLLEVLFYCPMDLW